MAALSLGANQPPTQISQVLFLPNSKRGFDSSHLLSCRPLPASSRYGTSARCCCNIACNCAFRLNPAAFPCNSHCAGKARAGTPRRAAQVAASVSAPRAAPWITTETSSRSRTCATRALLRYSRPPQTRTRTVSPTRSGPTTRRFRPDRPGVRSPSVRPASAWAASRYRPSSVRSRHAAAGATQPRG